MEPRIQYAKTKDGVSIAFWTLGEGMPLVHAPLPGFSHIQMEWQIPEIRHFYESMAAKRRLVRFDLPGTGLSQRDVSDQSIALTYMDASLGYLETLADRLDLQRFALFAPIHSGPLAIAYAARHPERVSHLILWCSYVRVSDWTGNAGVQATRSLIERDWLTYSETAAQAYLAWSGGELARRLAALLRESVTPEAVMDAMSAASDIDVTALLPQVRSPTLVLHRRQLRGTEAVARDLTSGIPDARLVLLEGESVVPFAGDTDAVLAAIDEFLGEGEEAAAEAEAPEPGAFRTILFTDVEDSTALTQRLGDARAREVLRTHERIVREALNAHGGTEVKTMGDGFMASFSSATRALECAIATQRAFADYNAQVGAQGLAPLRIRIGLNAGEPIAEEDDLFGTAVITAARIATKAQGGEILTSDTVRGLVAGKGFLFSDRGETALRGFEDPVRLYELRWKD